MLKRGIVFGVVVATALAALTGCSASSIAAGYPGLGAVGGATIAREALPQVAIEAKVGQCWSLTYAQFHEQPENAGGVLVDCSTPHQAYTFAVDKLSEGDDQREDNIDLAMNNCADRLDALIPDRAAAARVYVSAVLPTDAQWATHDRDTACLVMSTEIGTPLRNPTFIDLPDFSALVSAVNASPTSYYGCVNDPGTTSATGPSLGLEAILATCATAQWTLEPTPDFPDPAGVDYPGYDGLLPFMHAHCGAIYDTATRRGWDLYPSAEQWAEGNREFSCWTGAR